MVSLRLDTQHSDIQHNDTQYNDTQLDIQYYGTRVVLRQVSFMPNKPVNAECHYPECQAECHYTGCSYVECRYAECRGTEL
jgi:hypothetical protein